MNGLAVGHGTISAARTVGQGEGGAEAVVPAASRHGPWPDASASRRQTSEAPLCRAATDV